MTREHEMSTDSGPQKRFQFFSSSNSWSSAIEVEMFTDFSVLRGFPTKSLGSGAPSRPNHRQTIGLPSSSISMVEPPIFTEI